ncbi:MAG: dethiobiotin synthase [Methylacidiphilales bacterium]|nr:dethiobiotin synthase [Candidatus Methylacidiphilales bacterium]
MNGIFITGTGTGVGKTFFTAACTRALRKRGIPALALKPISCGGRTDEELYAKANEETLSLNEINHIHLAPPLSPYAASAVENKPFDLSALRDGINSVTARHPGPFLIEGVGGWLVPITRDYWVRDWARELDLPVCLVAGAGLGTINHTLLTVESIRQSGARILGIVLNHHGVPDDMAAQTNPAILEDLSGLPVLRFHGPEDLLKLPSWLLP